MTIQDQAMLANLSIHQWTARKHDRKATREVDQAHGANNAGRYNKLLVDKAALMPLQSAASALRDLHYTLTLPWGDNGDRVLPSKLFFDYTAKMQGATETFRRAVDVFVAQYPQLVVDARKRLGTLYEPGDYPDARQIASRFGAEISFTSIAAAQDFRVNVGAEHVERIRNEITRQAEKRLEEATKSCWERVRGVVERYAVRMADEKGRVFESMVENARELVALLPALNLTNDPELARVTHEIEHRLLPFTIGQLRNSATARQKVAAAANDILENFKWG